MKRFMLAMLLLGSALLVAILYQTDLGEVWSHLRQVGGWGLAAIFLAYFVGFLGQSGAWLFTLRPPPWTPTWCFRVWKLLMFGSALESVTPLAGFGGEPVKAIVLKRHYGIRVREATTSLVLARTTDLVAQIAFISIGFALMLHAGTLPLPYRIAAGSGLALFVVAIALFIAAQRTRTLSRLQGWLERGWLGGRRLSRRAVTALDALHDIDDGLVSFYESERRRFVLSSASAFVEWSSGAVATWFAVNALGHPITLAEAVVIESFVVLVRSAFFFVPADIGTQEGAQVLICSAVTGSPALGLALATIRRSRDLLWILVGLGIGWLYSREGATAIEEIQDDEQPEPEPDRAPVPGTAVTRAASLSEASPGPGAR